MTMKSCYRTSAGAALAAAGLALCTVPADAQSLGRLHAVTVRTASTLPAPSRWTAPPVVSWGSPGGTAVQGRDSASDRVDRSTRTLSLGPNGSLELQNVSGDISVTAGSGRDVTIDIVRRVRARSDADAALGLSEIQVTVDHRGERASVSTVYPNGRRRLPYQVSTAFIVTAPPGTRVTARSVSGNVVVKNVTGDVAVETVSGNVDVTNAKQVSKARSISGDVMLSQIDGTWPLTAGTISGSVQLLHVRASRISAEVMSGDIRADDVACDSAQMKSLSGSVNYAGQFSAGGRYEFNSHSGSVRVAALGPVGFELQATTFSGRIRPEGLSLQAMTMNRGSLRATIGDGSAVVVAQTFSGDVVISRK